MFTRWTLHVLVSLQPVVSWLLSAFPAVLTAVASCAASPPLAEFLTPPPPYWALSHSRAFPGCFLHLECDSPSPRWAAQSHSINACPDTTLLWEAAPPCQASSQSFLGAPTERSSALSDSSYHRIRSTDQLHSSFLLNCEHLENRDCIS